MTEKEKLLVEAARRGILPEKPPKKPARPVGLTDVLVHGASFGTADEISAGASATGNFIRNLIETGSLGQAADAAGQAYGTRLDEFRTGMERYRAEHPFLSTGAEILGGLGTGGHLAKQGLSFMNVARPTLGHMAAAGAAEGAAYGGAYGFGTGEGGFTNRMANAGTDAALGAVTGGATGALSGMLANRAAQRLAPTTDDLARAANAAYGAAEQAGVVVAQPRMAVLADDLVDAARQAGVDRTIHPKVTAALQRIQEASGTTPTLKDLDILRRILKSAAAGGPEAADERRIATLLIDRFDDFVNGLKAADVVAGDVLTATSQLNRGREMWSRLRKTELVEDAVERATRRAASTGSGGNVDNAIRQNIRAILDSPKKARGFTAEERKLMEAVVKGGPLQNLLRLVGKLSPEGSGLMAMLHTIGGVSSGGATVPLMGAGWAAKRAADAMTPARVASLLSATRSGGQVPVPALTGPQRALLESMIVGGAQQAPNLLPGR